MFWKIYAWIYAVVILYGAIVLVPLLPQYNPIDFVGVIGNILLVLAIFSVAYKKEILPKKVWAFIFVLMIIEMILSLLMSSGIIPTANFLESGVVDAEFSSILVATLLSVPSIIAVYKLGFAKKNTQF